MSQPKLITKPFADDALPGYVNEIPKENPVGAPEQNASWAVGFPPITMADLADGGLPPNGEDMNGVLRAITEHNLFIGGGGVYKFTSEYIADVGGYSKGAVLISDDKTALWMSIQDNNTQNFNGETKNQWRRIAFTELDLTLYQIQGELDDKVGLSGDQTVSGTKKFTSFPVTPSAAPTDIDQVANKKYVDDSAIGVGQKWVQVSKVSNTTYTNTTGGPIAVAAQSYKSTAADGERAGLSITVSGITVQQGVSNATPSLGLAASVSLSAIVPAGETYSISDNSIGSGFNFVVMELRS